MDFLITYDRPLIDTYGEVYHESIRILSNKGYSVSSLNLGDFIESYNFTDNFLREFIEKDKPKVIISHLPSLRNSINYIIANSLPTNYVFSLEEEIETFFIKNFPGSVQTNSHYLYQGAIEFKEGFVETMSGRGLPIPKTILKSTVGDNNWNYNYLSKELGNNFVVKDITKSKGEGVSLVSFENSFQLSNCNVKVAQKRINSGLSNISSTLRAITFPNEIVGLFFYYHESDGLRSNISPGYRKIFLNENNNSMLNKNERKIAKRTGLNLGLQLRKNVKDLILKVSSIPSQSLLRGMDIIFDEKDCPYFLEAQTNPGNSYADTYPLILGNRVGTKRENICMAADVIADYLERYLINHK